MTNKSIDTKDDGKSELKRCMIARVIRYLTYIGTTAGHLRGY